MHKGLFIADIHIGVVSIEETKEQLKMYEEQLKSVGPLDFLIIGGDLFDKQLYENDPYIIHAMEFLQISFRYASKVRIVYGTSSHEAMQYKLFEKIFDPKVYDLKVIYTVTEEQLFEDVKVLYIPEEYIYDKAEYYKEYLEKENEYQYVFGHGMIYEAFQGKIKPSTGASDRRKAPVFSTGELSKCCCGDVLFGHYHVHTEFEGDVSYVGSYYRWIQGEEEAKGCYLLTFYDGESHKEFMVNPIAKLYITKIYGYDDSVFSNTEELEEDCTRLINLQEKQDIEKLRIIYNIPLGYENAERLMKYVKERFRSNKHIQVEFKNGYVEETKKIADTPIDEEMELYQFVRDPNIPEEEKVSKFLKMKKNADLKAEIIKKYLDALEV